MTIDFSEAEIEVPCPKCGQRTAQTLAGLADDGNLTCAGCGVRFEVEGAGRVVDDAQQAVADARQRLRRTVRRFDKRR